jgi:hypothetical protein
MESVESIPMALRATPNKSIKLIEIKRVKAIKRMGMIVDM